MSRCPLRPKHATVGLLALSLFALAALSLPTTGNTVSAAGGAQLYIDSVNGNDSNSGTSADAAWKTFTPLYRYPLGAGDTINLARGSSWDTGLRILRSGSQGSPITVRPYGSGAAPAISNVNHDGTGHDRPVWVDADWIVIEGLYLHDSLSAGVYLQNGASHNIVRGCEAVRTGAGVTIAGQYNSITGNYFHDLVLEQDTGSSSYGAVGVNLFSSNNEISYNTIVNCSVTSTAHGLDGGGIEFYNTANNNYIHHNFTKDAEGYIEVGGGSARNNTVAYNIIVDSGRLLGFHLGGQYAAVVENFRFENNTVVDTRSTWTWSLNYFMNGTPDPSVLTMRNNIIHILNYQQVFNSTSFTHNYNLYNLLSPTTVLGFPLDSTEFQADPQFVNVAAVDLRLSSSSPAIGAGRDSSGAVVDLGALPYAQQPTVLGVYPNLAPSSGGAQVTVSGRGFQSGMQVYVAGQACQSAQVLSPVQAICVVPAHDAGAAAVAVVNPDGSSYTLDSALYYDGLGGSSAEPTPTTSASPTATPSSTATAAPTSTPVPTATPDPGPVIVEVRSNRGNAYGHTRVKIHGRGFVVGATVRLDGARVLTTEVVSAFEIELEVAANLPATVDISVTNPDGKRSTLADVVVGAGDSEIYMPLIPQGRASR